MKVGNTVKVVRGNHIGMIGKIKSKDHSYRNFGVKKYGLRFNILKEDGDVVIVDANDVILFKDEAKVIKRKLIGDKQPNEETYQAD